jgi:TATA-box binding protein (TBP) (component of TFIID and TFIIIB)
MSLELKDYIIIGALIFNSGGWIYTMANHMRHVNKSLKEIFKWLREHETRISHTEGKLDD